MHKHSQANVITLFDDILLYIPYIKSFLVVLLQYIGKVFNGPTPKLYAIDDSLLSDGIQYDIYIEIMTTFGKIEYCSTSLFLDKGSPIII